MAVDSDCASKQSVSRKGEGVESPQVKESKSQSQENVILSSPGKRNKSPGIRVVGGRIYDPINGKTCHQCRQKTRDFVAACKSVRSNKPCPIMYCHKCLLNRYGENAEEVAGVGEWNCPKCRGICNCSICMKKRGHQPTGMLINTAKATGYSSVSEMLLKGVDILIHEKALPCTVASPKKDPPPEKSGNENSLCSEADAELPNHVEKKSKKGKVMHKGRIDDGPSLMIISQSPDERKLNEEILEGVHDCNRVPGLKESDSHASEKISKKLKRDMLDSMNNAKKGEEVGVQDDEKKQKKSRKSKLENGGIKDGATLVRTTPKKLKVAKKMPKCGAMFDIGIDSKENVNTRTNVDVSSDNGVLRNQDAGYHVDIPLPLGEVVIKVAGIDIPADDVGNALQFLEFCAAFGMILEVKKGQPELVLQDIFHGRTGRRGKFSLTVQFHINVLSILLTEHGEECTTLSSWFVALKTCLSESQSVIKAQGLDYLEKVADYESLTASEKLLILNFLCDEVLETEKVRNWMDEQSKKLSDKVKEAKQKILAARDKEKSLKQKMKDSIAEAVMAKHGAPLTISEHDALVSHIKHEAEQAHTEVLESKGIYLKSNQIPNAVRIKPIFVGSDGQVYWKLNSYGESFVLHQDTGKRDALTSNEKWFVIDDEGKGAIEKRISSFRGKRLSNLSRADHP